MKAFTPITLVLISIGLFYLFTDPHYMKVKTLMEERSQYQTALANIQSIGDLRDSLESSYNNLPQDQVARLEKVIPQNFNVVKVAADLDGMAARHGMSVRNVKVTDAVNDTRATVQAGPALPYKSSTFSFSVSGTYPNFVAFLRDIEHNLELVDVRSVSLRSSPSANGSISNVFQFDIAVETYWIQ